MTEKVRRSSAPTEGNDEIDIGRLFGTVLEARWWVIGITGMFALLAAVYALFATPVYKADALVQIEQNAGNTLVNDISSALSNKPPASAAEIQLIQSRLVLGKTVDDLNLDISVTKNTFWLFGAGWDRLQGHQNDTVNVTTFTLPAGMNKDTFTVEVLNDKRYQLTSDNGFSAKGEVGKLLSQGGVTMQVDGIQAQPGDNFTVVKYSTLGMINQLLGNLTVTENGKDTGVLSLSYTGEDKDQIRTILDSITRQLSGAERAA
ncbi:Tyrosine-protein kinase wzc [Cedecea neteri]|uniref:Tyrosine-protein kinase wzc n=1 Tax=Cedecea neteri TaxID=158822 RepID=A0A2X3IXU7_9ENTR|nr:Tyrosine-protein kinase wzc [Cedecea neteri]